MSITIGIALYTAPKMAASGYGFNRPMPTEPLNPWVKRDAAKIARVFHDIIGAEAPDAGVKARRSLSRRQAAVQVPTSHTPH
ncbi:MAG: hypothetical protein A3J49_04780 [Gallionellales bacterium RIFCSPHIGHO2_02_FULL_57_16]|nr:MAG: hypothetical protein A3J49_04780 [Gallionellales bacterium RIFCSPHIGHO2_02_FULL_57_16]